MDSSTQKLGFPSRRLLPAIQTLGHLPFAKRHANTQPRSFRQSNFRAPHQIGCSALLFPSCIHSSFRSLPPDTHNKKNATEHHYKNSHHHRVFFTNVSLTGEKRGMNDPLPPPVLAPSSVPDDSVLSRSSRVGDTNTPPPKSSPGLVLIKTPSTGGSPFVQPPRPGTVPAAACSKYLFCFRFAICDGPEWDVGMLLCYTNGGNPRPRDCRKQKKQSCHARVTSISKCMKNNDYISTIIRATE